MNNEEQKLSIQEIISQSYDFSDMSAEEQERVVNETATMISESALLRGLEAAGDNVQKAFGILMESEPTEPQIAEFIAINIPNFETLIVDEIKIFQEMTQENKDTIS